ncbi:DUF4911 domain-containing protein [Thermosipho atlanticus]|uniref:DUF4911 domain-containing protein n=1 Tax=Thermosipho atlanticus DSM 15807 TaxID=1123380 RepID=A0A1M5SQA5_9BACT|nr:DUF4911 domain-containing protein [Thermosipho atlanticus]SHH40709.1 protein of unknown function [Thermosipho atlanticus DSM 15807]
MEFDILIKIEKEKVHLLSYILEAEDNFLNIRKYEDGILRIIVPEDLKEDAQKLLESLKEKIGFEIYDIRKNSGSAD